MFESGDKAEENVAASKSRSPKQGAAATNLEAAADTAASNGDASMTAKNALPAGGASAGSLGAGEIKPGPGPLTEEQEAAAAAKADAEAAAAAVAAAEAAEAERLKAVAEGECVLRYEQYDEKFPISNNSTTAAEIDEAYCLSFVMPNCAIHLSKVPNQQRLKLINMDPAEEGWIDP